MSLQAAGDQLLDCEFTLAVPIDIVKRTDIFPFAFQEQRVPGKDRIPGIMNPMLDGIHTAEVVPVTCQVIPSVLD